MAELEKLKKKLTPLFDAEKGFSTASGLDSSDSYMMAELLIYLADHMASTISTNLDCRSAHRGL